MKNIKKIVAALAITTVSIYMSGCALIAKTPEAIAKSAVATVNGEKVTRAQFDQRMTLVTAQLNATYGSDFATTAQGKQIIETERSSTLTQMIEETLELQKAKELKVVKDEKALDKQVSTQYDQIKTSYSDEKTFLAAIKQYGYDAASLKSFLKTQAIISALQESQTKNVTVSDDDAKTYYDGHPFEFTTESDTMHVMHILVKTEAEAKTVKARLDKGEDFATVAKEVSTDTGSKDNGGDLGDIDYANNNLDATFFKACLALKVNVVSNPVQTQFGFHIIKVTKKTEYPEKKYDDVKASIKTNLLTTKKQTQFKSILAKWKKAAKIETKKYEKNLTATSTSK